MIEVVRELNRSYLSITQENDNIYDYTMKMVENNSVEGLLAVRKSVVNNKTSYLYDISGCIPLEEKYVKDEFDGDDILVVADSVNKLINTMERYMLDINSIIFDIKYIFCGINDSSWKYVYNSELTSDARSGIKKLFEYILGHLDHRDNNAVILGYGIYKRICRDEILLQKVFDNIDELMQLRREKADRTDTVQYELNKRTYPSVAQTTVTEEHEKKLPDKKFILAGAGLIAGAGVLAGLIWGAVTAVVTAIIGGVLFGIVFMIILKGPTWEKIVTSELKLPYETENPEIKAHNETIDIWHYEAVENGAGSKDSKKDMDKGMDGATVVIGAQALKSLRRISKSGQGMDEYLIMEDSVSVGSGSSADIIIKDSGISRLHARITREGEMFFIKDMNSTNGTWINERRISVYELCPIKNGDVIRLARSSFELIDTVE